MAARGDLPSAICRLAGAKGSNRGVGTVFLDVTVLSCDSALIVSGLFSIQRGDGEVAEWSKARPC